MVRGSPFEDLINTIQGVWSVGNEAGFPHPTKVENIIRSVTRKNAFDIIIR